MGQWRASHPKCVVVILAAFLIATLTLACSSAPAQRTAAPPAAPPAGRVFAAAPSQLITPVIVLPTPTAIPQPTPRAGDVNTDRAALAALYNATNGSSWRDDTNWVSSRPLGEWHGVSTDADGRVTELDPLRQRVERVDTVATGQPRLPAKAGAPRQSV